MSSTKPGPVQRVSYFFGRTLPAEMRDWVRDDILGPGGSRRYLVRWVTPLVPFLLLFLLIPGPVWVPLAMMLLLLLPLVYFAVALMPIWQRHRLEQHGIDPMLLGAKARLRADNERRDYERRFGRAV